MEFVTEHPIVTALVLTVIAVALAFPGWQARTRRLALLDTPTLTAAQLADSTARTGGLLAEVTGTAEPGPAGRLTAPFSDEACVWYRTEVVRHYRQRVRDSKGNHRTRNRSETVESNTSFEPLLLRDDTGRVTFHPDGADVDRPVRSHERYEPARRGAPNGAKAQALHLAREILTDGSGTTGYTYREWVVRPGQRLFAFGRVTAEGETLAMRRPEQGPFLLSTRSEREITRGDWTSQRLFFGGALAVVLLAMGVLVYGLFR
ncbi:GIDE domain-containing protein [Marinactinospora rubrisoli]|uniref:RING-type E3 ubiquitin transferase n=1 Tax=Marinactinospora rubrisoli TaxID=2715399 RepID=A0ABW2KAX5_9ACTN